MSRRQLLVASDPVSLWMAWNGALYAAHTECGEQGQWVHGDDALWTCLMCRKKLEFENINSADQTFQAQNGPAGVREWASKWLEVPESRIDVCIDWREEATT